MGILTFLRKDTAEKKRILFKRMSSFIYSPFRSGKTLFGSSYLSYIPDFFEVSENKSDLLLLVDRFIKNNKGNNSGDIPRLISFILNCKQILSEGVQGDFAELGVYKGNTAAILAYYANRTGRKVYLFDTYEGFNTADLQGIDSHKEVIFNDTSLTLVEEIIGIDKDACEFIKGYFPSSIEEIHKEKQYSIVSLDCDLYEPMKAGLEFFYPRMPKGGIFFLHDYSSTRWEGAKLAIDEFRRRTGELVILMPDKSGSAFIRKNH